MECYTNHPYLKNLSIMLEFYLSLARIEKSMTFYLIDCLIRLILSPYVYIAKIIFYNENYIAK